MSGPRALRVMLAGLTLVMLGAAVAFGEDAARQAPPDPDPGLLEFLGSVDGLAEVSPDYLAQAERARALPALSVAAARAAPRAAQPMGEVPVAAAAGADEGAGEFSQIQAAAAGAPPDAARAMAQREPRPAPGDDPSGARAAAEARGGASAGGAPGQGAASAAPLIISRRRSLAGGSGSAHCTRRSARRAP